MKFLPRFRLTYSNNIFESKSAEQIRKLFFVSKSSQKDERINMKDFLFSEKVLLFKGFQTNFRISAASQRYSIECENFPNEHPLIFF